MIPEPKVESRADIVWPFAAFILVTLVAACWLVTHDVRVEWVLFAWGEALRHPLIALAALAAGAADRRWRVSLFVLLIADICIEACVQLLGWPRFTPLDGWEHLMAAGRFLALLLYAAFFAIGAREFRRHIATRRPR